MANELFDSSQFFVIHQQIFIQINRPKRNKNMETITQFIVPINYLNEQHQYHYTIQW